MARKSPVNIYANKFWCNIGVNMPGAVGNIRSGGVYDNNQ